MALEYLGGSADQHDVALFYRLTGATYATHLTLVTSGDVVLGVSTSYSHPSVVRAVAQAGATLVDTKSLEDFKAALERESRVALIVMTRLAVTYEIMPESVSTSWPQGWTSMAPWGRGSASWPARHLC